MKEYDVLISEEVAYKYRIKAETEEQAEELAMDNHLKNLEVNKIAESIDRCEIIECVEVKNVKDNN